MESIMLIENGLAKHYQGKAINTANYIVYMQCYVHNNGKDDLGKFDARSNEGIFLGYALNSKAYRVLNNCRSMVKESIHVVFDEWDNGILSECFNQLT